MRSAGVAELVDALDLGSSDESCGVRVPPPAPSADSVCMRIQVDLFPQKEWGRRTATQTPESRVDQIDRCRAPHAGPSREEDRRHAGHRNPRRGIEARIQISVPASDIDAKVDARLVDMKDKVKLNGFRPGKVPVAHLKKVYGRSVLAGTVRQSIPRYQFADLLRTRFSSGHRAEGHDADRGKAVEDILAGKSI